MDRTPLSARRSAVRSYLVALLAVSVTSLLREKLRPVLTDHSVFAMDYLAIAFAAWYGGIGPGLAAAFTSVPFAMLILWPKGFAPESTANWIALLLFLVISIFITALIESVRRARERAVAAMDAARESQQKYQGLFERNLAGVSRTTLDGRVLECNRALARIYGYADPAELTAVAAESLHESADARRSFLERLRAAGGTLVNIEAVGRRRDGSPVWTLESHQLVEEGGETVIEGSLLDISERKRVEHEREILFLERESERSRFEAVIREMPAGVAIADRTGRLILGNDQYERILRTKFDGSQRVGQNQGVRAFHADGRPLAPDEGPLARALASGEEVRNAEVLIEREDGSRATILVNAAPLRGPAGAVEGAVGTFFEVTEQRELARELARMVGELREADRRKNEFIAMLAHELRNPLVPIANAVHVLRGASGPETEERSRAMIERQLLHMVRLIDDLLDVSRISRGKIEMRFERFDFAAGTREVLSDFREECARHGLALEERIAQAPMAVLGDRVRLSQVLTNILRNAIKFTDPGGRISVELDRQGDQVRLAVRDTGIGIDAEMLPRVFEAFSQADRSVARSRGGLGLGLALVEGIVQSHHGEARASSPGVGHGSEFTIFLPAAPAGAMEMPAPESLPLRPEAVRRVLLVEDNPVVADGMRFLLEHLGHEVRVAPDGEEALAAVREWRPDVVLCDIGLPGSIDGYALARLIRAHPELAEIRLIAVTGYGQEGDRLRTEEAGFDLHLTKPVQPSRLVEILAAAPRASALR
jgi:PAS domain S-box-containing protein